MSKVIVTDAVCIGLVRGAVGAPAPPGRRKKFRRNLQRKVVSAPPAHQVHPQAEQESSVGTFLWERFRDSINSFRPSLRRRPKKVVNFFEKKVHPADKILATPTAV